MLVAILFVLIALILGSITDFDRHEVPDWINWGLVFLGIATGIVSSLFYWDYSYALASLVGLGVGFAIGGLMYYTGQWGGGDAKMIMGIGAMLGFDMFAFYQSIISGNNLVSIFFSSLFLLFLILSIFVGAIYGIFWSFGLIIIHRKEYFPAFRRKMTSPHLRVIRYVVYAVTILCIILMFMFKSNIIFLTSFFTLAVLVFVGFYLFVGVKLVEKICMIKSITPDKLTEGDWIAQDIFVGKKRITGPKDLGISKKQIVEVTKYWKAKKIDKIFVKYGIPFVPSFLIAFIGTLFLYFFALF